jgi:hypothetical protein
LSIFIPLRNKKHGFGGSGELLNTKLNAQQGFHPRHFVLPKNAITPKTGNTVSSLSVQGRYGGTGTVPSFIVPIIWI